MLFRLAIERIANLCDGPGLAGFSSNEHLLGDAIQTLTVFGELSADRAFP